MPAPFTPSVLPICTSISPIDTGLGTGNSYFGGTGMSLLLDEEVHDVTFSALSGKSWDASPPMSPGLTISFDGIGSNNSSRKMEETLDHRNCSPVLFGGSLRKGKRSYPTRYQNDSPALPAETSTTCDIASFLSERTDQDSFLPDHEEDLSFTFSPSIFSPNYGAHRSAGGEERGPRSADLSAALDLSKSRMYPPSEAVHAKALGAGDGIALIPSQAQPYLSKQTAPKNYGAYRNEENYNVGMHGQVYHYNGTDSFSHNGFNQMKMFRESISEDLSASSFRAPSATAAGGISMGYSHKDSIPMKDSGTVSASGQVAGPVRRKTKLAKASTAVAPPALSHSLPHAPPPHPLSQQQQHSPNGSRVAAASAARLPPPSMVRSSSTVSLNTSVEAEESSASFLSPREGKAGPLPCKCKKSRCLKLYCDCFAILKFCDKHCSCRDCFNTNSKDFETQRNTAIESIKEKNPLAFQTKISDAEGTAQHSAGCHCKQSHCLKKYCECFHGGANCGTNCKCQNCKNFSNSKELQDVRSRDGGGGGTASVAPEHARRTGSANALKTLLPEPLQPQTQPQTQFLLQKSDQASSVQLAVEVLPDEGGGGGGGKRARVSYLKKRKESAVLDDSMDSSPSTTVDSTLADTSFASDKADGGMIEFFGLSPPVGAEGQTRSSIGTATTTASDLTQTPDVLCIGTMSLASTEGRDELEDKLLILPDAVLAKGSQSHYINGHGHGHHRFEESAMLQGRVNAEQMMLRRERIVARLQQRSSKEKLGSPSPGYGSPFYLPTDSGLPPLPVGLSNQLVVGNALGHPLHHFIDASTSRSAVYDSSTNSGRQELPGNGAKKRKGSETAQTYRFFGENLPATTKLVALICLDFLDAKDLFSMSAVNSLVSIAVYIIAYYFEFAE